MITKWYEIVCDVCGNAEHYLGSVQCAEEEFRSCGGVVTADRKHYCDGDCFRKRKKAEK